MFLWNECLESLFWKNVLLHSLTILLDLKKNLEDVIQQCTINFNAVEMYWFSIWFVFFFSEMCVHDNLD